MGARGDCPQKEIKNQSIDNTSVNYQTYSTNIFISNNYLDYIFFLFYYRFHLYDVVVPGVKGSVIQFLKESGLLFVKLTERLTSLLFKQQYSLSNQYRKLEEVAQENVKIKWKNWQLSYRLTLS